MYREKLSHESIKEKLKTKTLGSEIIIIESVDSTNSFLKRQSGALCDGCVALAEGQTSGRGRFGKTFFSPSGDGVYMSVLIKPRRINNFNLLTMFCAVAVCRALKNACSIDASVKWVNDIIINGKKICGILAESAFSGEASSVCLGIGINTGEIPSEVFDIATSVSQITGVLPDRNEIVADVLNNLEKIIFPDGADIIFDALSEYIERLI